MTRKIAVVAGHAGISVEREDIGKRRLEYLRRIGAHFCMGLGEMRYAVYLRTSRDPADVHRKALRVIGNIFDFSNHLGDLSDRARPLPVRHAGVRSFSGRGYPEFSP